MEGVDALADAAAAAVSALHASGAGPAQLAAAREAFEKSKSHPQSHQIAFRLADARRPPQVQHLGFQVLLSALRARSSQRSQDLGEAKRWLISLLVSDRWASAAASPQVAPGQEATAGTSPPYVRGKCAEAVAELARLEWPEQWPELKPTLLAACGSSSAGLAALALASWNHLADVMAEDSKDLTVQRRRDMKTALAALMEQPSQAPVLVGALQKALQQHGADRYVVMEALGACRSLVNAVPVQVMLQHNLDRIVQVGLEIAELRAPAVSALAEWVERACPGKGNIPNPAVHDLARFTGMLARLAGSCRFDGEQQNYAFHRQVSELLTDLCANNAASMAYLMGSVELGAVWQALLHFLRYPSATMQHDALVGMVHLAKAQAGGWSSGTGSPPRPPLEELLGPMFLHVIKAETLTADALTQDRSAWLLRHLGRPSTAEPPTSVQGWHQLLEQSRGLELCGGAEGGPEERSFMFGTLKVKTKELLDLICGPAAAGAAESGEGYGALCRMAGQLVLRSLSEGWFAEFDAAAQLVERAGPTALRAVEKKSKQELDAVLQPSLEFLQKVTVATASFSSALEYKRIEFLSHWAAFYKHFGADVVAQVLQRLLAVVEQQPGAEGGSVALQQRALDTLVSLGKSGALTPAQLEVLNTECGRLSPKLSPAARGKLVEALASAVASCGALQPAQQAQLIWGIMEQATASFCASEHARPSGAAQLAAIVSVAASTPGAPVTAAGGSPDEPALMKLREVRTLLHVFTGVVTRTVTATGGGAGTSEQGAAGSHIVGRLVQAWAPGVFALAQSLLGLAAAAAAMPGPGPVLLGMPSDAELFSIQGPKAEEVKEVLPDGLDVRKVQAVRSLLFELRGAASKAMRACLACPDFWAMSEACGWVQSVAESLATQWPHVADMLLKDVFSPAFGRGGISGAGRDGVGCGLSGPTSAAMQTQLGRAVVPPVAASIGRLLRGCWASGGSGDPTGAAPTPAALEAGLAASSVAVSRTASLFLSELAGAGLPQAGVVANPERKLFAKALESTWDEPALEPMGAGNKKRKNRNRNRFAALAEDTDAAASAAVAAATGAQAPALPPPLPGAAVAVLRERGPREVVRQALVDLLDVPEKETVQRALVGLSVWSAQVWNLVCRGEDSAAAGLGASNNKQPEAGELLHVAGDALRPFPGGILKPVARLVEAPPDMQQATGAAGGAAKRAPVACSAALATRVQQSWQAYISASRMHGKPGPSGVVADATQVVLTVLLVLTRLFKLQCRKLQQKCTLEQVYVCPALFEAAQLLRNLPNTTEGDVEGVLKTFVEDEGATLDAQKSAVRVLLHEASPAFVPEPAG